MSKLSRFLTAVAALLLLGLFVWPAWRISLEAPQYPEGLGMHIRINTIEGESEFDLTKINNLNHYIGMKPIVPEAIPELKYMPWIVVALVVSGLGVAALGRRKLLYGWLVAFALLGAAGLGDFYRWSYDYGHNLDAETAIIIVPGMSYQPPLIGEKQLLNFRAASWPALGGILAGLGFAVGAVAAGLTFSAGRRSRGAISAVALAAAACSMDVEPRPIAYDGTESCELCRMAVTDRQYGAQLVTATGKVHLFDSIECLASFQAQARGMGPVASIWVSDVEKPGSLVAANQARFVRSRGSRNSPMGLGLMAFSPASDSAALRERFGVVLTWTDVVALVETEDLSRAVAAAAHDHSDDRDAGAR